MVEDVYMADALVSQVETAVGRKKKIGFGLIIEATMGTFDKKQDTGEMMMMMMTMMMRMMRMMTRLIIRTRMFIHPRWFG